MSRKHEAASGGVEQAEKQRQPDGRASSAAERTANDADEMELSPDPSEHAGAAENGEIVEDAGTEPTEQATPEFTEQTGDGAPGDLESELKRLQTEVEEHHQRFLRTQADFDNYRKRTLREKEEFAKYASMNLVEQLLPVLDNFERALAAGSGGSDADALHKGVEMIYRQFIQVLEQEGLKPIPAAGEPFNPEFHQAVMQVESEEHGEGIVVEELQKGYFLKDKVLRPTMVKVSS